MIRYVYVLVCNVFQKLYGVSLTIVIYLPCRSIRDNANRENLGIVVQYRVKVRLIMSMTATDVVLELPFTLTHPKPITPPPSRPVSVAHTDAAVDMNLIQLE